MTKIRVLNNQAHIKNNSPSAQSKVQPGPGVAITGHPTDMALPPPKNKGAAQGKTGQRNTTSSSRKRPADTPATTLSPTASTKKKNVNTSGELMHGIDSDASGILSDSESLPSSSPVSSYPKTPTPSNSPIPNFTSASSNYVAESSSVSTSKAVPFPTPPNRPVSTQPHPTNHSQVPQQSVQVDLDTIDTDHLPSTANEVILASDDPQRPITHTNPHKLQIAIDAICGPVTRVEYLKNQTVIITTNTAEQTKLLLDTKYLPNLQLSVHATIAWQRQFTYGKLYAEEFRHDSLSDLLEILRPHKVVKLRKLFSDPAKAHVPLYVLTFLGPTPQSITIGYVKFPVDKYTPAPLRCRNCWRLRHPTSKCRSLPTCNYC